MKGTGKTVFSGTKVESFDVEILGVLDNAGPRQSVILARLSGGPLEQTGVMQGMSGSPVYIGGRLIGAVAMGFPFAKEPIAGIRPIGEMIREATPTQAAGIARPVRLSDKSLVEGWARKERADAFDSNPVDIATPLSFSGFTKATVDQFAPQLRTLGLEPRQGLTGGGNSATGAGDPLQPGSMISVQLVTGDMNVAADGTVTHIEGDRLYAFGHRFLSVGGTELPFARAAVVALLPNLSSSFKISAGGEWLGAITGDYNAAVAGRLGRRPRLVPLNITVQGPGGSTKYQMEMVDDRFLAPLLLQMTLYSSLDATERTLGSGTVALRGEIEFHDGTEPMRIENVYAGDFNVPLQASLATAMPLAYALQNNLDALRLKNINLVVDSYAEKKQMHIEQVWTSKRQVRPGERLQVNALLIGEGGRELTQTITYDVPVGAPTGTLYFTVADASTTNISEYKHLYATEPRPAAQVISLLNSMRGNTKAYVRVWRADPGYNVEGEDLPDPPPSVGMVFARLQTAQGGFARTSTVAEFPFRAGDAVIAGSKTVQVEVKE